MGTDKNRGSMADLKPGDVLIPYSAAESRHDISIVPATPDTSSTAHDAAVGSEGVDGERAAIDQSADRQRSPRSARIARRMMVQGGFRRGL